MEVAAAWGRTQPQVTRVENANIDSLRIGTVRSYLEAVGSTLMLRAEPGTNRAGPDSVDLQGETPTSAQPRIEARSQPTRPRVG